MAFTATLTASATRTQVATLTSAPSATETILPTETPTFAPSTVTPTTVPVFQLPDNLKNTWIAVAEVGVGIHLVRADGAESRLLIDDPGNIYETISWSPDGHQIAFTYTQAASSAPWVQPQVCTINIDGTGRRCWTKNPEERCYNPIWSPDAHEIVYYSDSLKLLNLRTGNITSIAGGIVGTEPVWTVDGQELLFLTGEGNKEFTIHVWSIFLNAQNEQRLLLNFSVDPANIQIAWSQDRKQILFFDFRQGLAVVELDTGFISKGISIRGYPGNFQWSADNRYIVLTMGKHYFHAFPTQQEGDLYLLDLTTGATQRLTNQSFPQIGLAYPSWSSVPALISGERYETTPLSQGLLLYRTASLSGEFIRRLNEGDVVTVLEGPVDKDNYYWWRLRTEDGVEGWAVEMAGWYEPVEAESETPTPGP